MPDLNLSSVIEHWPLLTAFGGFMTGVGVTVVKLIMMAFKKIEEMIASAFAAHEKEDAARSNAITRDVRELSRRVESLEGKVTRLDDRLVSVMVKEAAEHGTDAEVETGR